MGWNRIDSYEWVEPLRALNALQTQPNLALLYSGLTSITKSYCSYLAWGLRETITSSSFASLPQTPEEDAHNLPHWIGYASYEMRLDVEKGARLKPCPISMPDMRWQAYNHILRFNHHEKTVEYFTWDDEPTANPEGWNQEASSTASTRYVLDELYSNFTSAEYVNAVANTVSHIENGDFYQANLTRKFFGRVDREIDPVGVFSALSKISPAPYSALIKTPNEAIISSSPECFLTADADGNLTAKPIKGSARRGRNDDEDAQIVLNLAASDKDHAENLMIVDLMRHDLAHISEPGSVTLEEYAGLYSYATIHHLVSSITAKRKKDVGLSECLQALFPPGSMTGAPKVAAMNWCAKQERIERGVYSGALGWLGAGGSCDLSVVIRTLITKKDQFEFQAGGGIVADSKPKAELEEMFTKTRGIVDALGIDDAVLRSI